MTVILEPGKFYGETISVPISDALLSEVRHSVGHDVPSHRHQAAYFSLLLEGTYSETVGELTIDYQPFTFIFHNALTEHHDSMGANGCRIFFIEVMPKWLDAIARLGGPPEHVFELHGGDPAWIALRLYHEFLARDAADPMTVESLLYELCAHVARVHDGDDREPPWLPTVDERIRSEFAQGFELRDLAANVGVNPSHLCRTFRRFRGRTVGDYVLGLRMQLVCRRLVESRSPLSDIAAEAGFTDQSHLTHVFKAFIGQSPGAYRRRLREGFAKDIQDSQRAT
ncbi:MAG: helix-turn-helix transcriptional regulator [Candidatus Eremiobacteraeota bacterium]|nr:helix-turn-helix transcriptional regulator [Candidatus Eremiobacteraeota bacterium]